MNLYDFIFGIGVLTVIGMFVRTVRFFVSVAAESLAERRDQHERHALERVYGTFHG